MAQASIAFLRSSNRGGSLTRLFGRRNATFFNANRPSLGCTDNDHGLFRHHLQHQHHEHRRSMGHSVRLIALEDLPHGKAYRGDVVRVKAGYARNHLIPQKLALYATPQNFEKLGLVDPDVETEEQRRERLAREASATVQEEAYLKAADILKKYLRNKVVRMLLFCLVRVFWRPWRFLEKRCLAFLLSNLRFIPFTFLLLLFLALIFNVTVEDLAKRRPEYGRCLASWICNGIECSSKVEQTTSDRFRR